MSFVRHIRDEIDTCCADVAYAFIKNYKNTDIGAERQTVFISRDTFGPAVVSRSGQRVEPMLYEIQYWGTTLDLCWKIVYLSFALR